MHNSRRGATARPTPSSATRLCCSSTSARSPGPTTRTAPTTSGAVTGPAGPGRAGWSNPALAIAALAERDIERDLG